MVLAEALTYEHKFHQFKPNFFKSMRYKNKILIRGERGMKTRNATLSVDTRNFRYTNYHFVFWPDRSFMSKNYLNKFRIF